MTTIAVKHGIVLTRSGWEAEKELTICDGVFVEADTVAAPDFTIDAKNRWIVPALTDAHCHLLPGHLLHLPAFGVGYAVDMFSTPRFQSAMARDGAISGVGFTTSGIGAAVRGGHPYQLVASGLYEDFPSVLDAGGPAMFVEALVARGDGFLKLFLEDGALAGLSLPTLDRATARELVAEAHCHGLIAIAHASTIECALKAIDAGVDGLAHAPIPESDVDIGIFVAAAKAADIFLVSTLVATASSVGLPQTASVQHSPLWNRVSVRWRSHLSQSASARPNRAALDRTMTLVAAAHAAGVRVYPGTDAAFPGVMPGLSLHVELELLADCGIPQTTLLPAVTSGVRDLLDKEGDGGLDSRAEIVVLGSNPLESITATAKVEWTILGDRVYRLSSEG